MMRPSRCLAVLMLALAVTVAAPAVFAASGKGRPAHKTSHKAVAKAPAATEIVLAHQLGEAQGAELEKLVARFNATNPPLPVRVDAAPFDLQHHQGALPNLVILGEADEASWLDGKPRYVPLSVLMRQAGEKLETLKPPPMMSPDALDSHGRLAGLPVGLSTPVMFYNKAAFAKAGVDPNVPPRTWWDLQDVLGKLRDAGYACPYTTTRPAWVHIENLSAWHNEPVVTRQGRREVLSINGLVQVKHLAMMSSWVKSLYMRVYDSDDEALQHFAHGDCAVLTAGQQVAPALGRSASFDIGVSAMPYHDDVRGAPQNTLADGAVMWATAGKSRLENKAAAKFVSFLLTPQTQVEWQRELGYLPLNRAGLFAATGSGLLKDDLQAVRVAIAQLTNKPATKASSASSFTERRDVQAAMNDELKSLWSGAKPAKQVLDEAVARVADDCSATRNC